MTRRIKAKKFLFNYDGSAMTQRKIDKLNKMATPRQRLIIAFALEGMTATEMVTKGVILSKTGQNHPITERAITREMRDLSKRAGIKFRINDLNFFYEIKKFWEFLND